MKKPASVSESVTSPAIQELEGRFRALVTATSDIIYSMSADWTEMRELAGRGFLADTVAPICNWMDKYIPSEAQGKVKEAIAGAIREKKVMQLEHEVIRADGARGWVLSRSVPILDAAGNIVEWFGAASDITARHNNEVALRRANERLEQQQRLYETITASTPDLIYVFDLDYRFTYANEALLTMWGKSWDEAIGKRLLENGYEDWHAKMHEREIDYVKATGLSIRGEVSFPHALLGRRIYDYIFTPVFNDEGEVEAVAGTTRDITDIRNAEAAISESENRFRTMAEESDVMIAVSDETGKATYFNERWKTTMGRSSEGLMDFGWLDNVHPDDKARVSDILAAAQRDRTSWNCAFRIPDSANGYRWLLTRGSVRTRPDGSFAGYISSAVDITEMKENEQRKNDFISMVSHELKTPLTSVIGFIQLLQKKAAQDADDLSDKLLQRVDKQLSKMANLINGFLNVSRLESSKIVMDLQPFEMGLLLREAEEEAHAVSDRHPILFDPSAPMWVLGDREKIGQVIHNLIHNAIKYSPAGSAIRIHSETTDSSVRVTVTDQGMGIDADNLPHLFERFFRVRNQETNSISGFGIGLYLCNEIIKGHGGEIGVQSTPGKGSSFYFSLPVSAAPVTDQ